MKRNASFNVEEIKVRWKKAALENCAGVPCVAAPSFTCGTSTISDIDGNVYETVSIGTQCWTKTNLEVTKYNDGTDIPLDANGNSPGFSTIWAGLRIGSYTIYGNEASSGTNATNYGFLYNWYAAKGIVTAGSTTYKNLCPTGYHVPTDAEWSTLTTFLSGSSALQQSVAAGKMKQIGFTLWNTPNTGADNTSGFTALPGGSRAENGTFGDIRDFAVFWSATRLDTNPNFAFRRLLSNNSDQVTRTTDFIERGLSVRCLKD